jgi:hypothetical protein
MNGSKYLSEPMLYKECSKEMAEDLMKFEREKLSVFDQVQQERFKD